MAADTYKVGPFEFESRLFNDIGRQGGRAGTEVDAHVRCSVGSSVPMYTTHSRDKIPCGVRQNDQPSSSRLCGRDDTVPGETQ